MKIGIIGLGYVGLTLAIAAADAGISVYGVEISQTIKNCLQKNKAHFFEPGLDALIRKHNGKNFKVVDSFPTDITYDAFIITVGTPLKKNEKKPNVDYIKSALQSIKNVYDGDSLIILRSTVSVGTTRNIVQPVLAALCGRSVDDVLVSMCPERTVEGKAVEELTHLPQIISGNNERALTIAQNLFRMITPYVIPVDSLEEAELVKLYCNTYRDMTFAIGNAFCMAAQLFGVNGDKVIQYANQGYDRANIALPGFVAGPCLEKDAYILAANMPDSTCKELIMNARHLNESLEDWVVSWVEEQVGPASEAKPIVLSGMAFKGKPETSDLRGSSSVYIAEKLKAKGYRLRLHDFVTPLADLKELALGECFEDVTEACNGAGALCILNNHGKYNSLACTDTLARNDFPILDTWGVCSELRNSDKTPYYSFGNMLIKEKK